MADAGGDWDVVETCRSCGTAGLVEVLDLGRAPLVDALVTPGTDRDEEPRYPLTLTMCATCSLVQLRERVPPTVLFGADYPYHSSYADAVVDNARATVDHVLDGRLPAGGRVIEVASNDGYLLQWFPDDLAVLGVDPAPGPVAAARARGVPTIQEFFTPALAQRLADEGRTADVVLANNVVAHVDDQHAFLDAVTRVLAPGGRVLLQFPYVRDLVAGLQFDTIYHEHQCYFSVTALARLAAPHGLQVLDVAHLDLHGGSLRVELARGDGPSPVAEAWMQEEVASGLLDVDHLTDFAARVDGVGAALRELLGSARDAGRRIAAYGAAAKGAVLLHHCRIDRTLLEYVVDRNPHKQGLEMPGVALPIVGPERLASDPPDDLLLLAWNFADEIAAQQAAFLDRGGRFLVPVPEPRVWSPS